MITGSWDNPGRSRCSRLPASTAFQRAARLALQAFPCPCCHLPTPHHSLPSSRWNPTFLDPTGVIEFAGRSHRCDGVGRERAETRDGGRMGTAQGICPSPEQAVTAPVQHTATCQIINIHKTSCYKSISCPNYHLLPPGLNFSCKTSSS